MSEVKDSSVKGRLKRFQFSTVQAYILELGSQSIRFYRHQAQITVADTDAVVLNGQFTSNITSWDDRSTGGAGNQISHGATNGRLTLETGGRDADDIGWAEQDITTTNTGQEHVLKFRVIGAPGDKIEFQVGTTSKGAETLAAVEKQTGYHCVAFTPSLSTFYVQFRNLGSNADKDMQIDDVSLIDNSAVEIDTPYAEADLFEIEGPQSADVLYLFHGSYPAHKLQRFGHTTWSIVEVAWFDGPYLDENDTDTTLLASAVDGIGVTFTLSSTVGVNGGAGWLSTDIGRLIRFKHVEGDPNWSFAVITSITSTTIAVGDIRSETNKFDKVWQTDDSASLFVNQTQTARDSSDGNFIPYPATEAIGDYCAMGHDIKFAQLEFDYAGGTAGVGGTTAWEYWNGTAWSALPNVADNTTGFTAAVADDLTVSFSLPDDWAKHSLNGSGSLYYVRARVTAGYSTNPVLDRVRVLEHLATEAVGAWKLGAWSGTTGYPQVGSFYEQRLYVAATNGQPQTFWASQTADFENHRPDDRTGTVEEDDAFNYTLSADDVNAIRWMSAGEDTLVVGTAGGEWVPSSDGIVITPLDITVRRQTTHGSGQVQPVRIGAIVLFVQKALRKVREFGLDQLAVKYAAPDMTRTAQHITKGGIVEIDYAEEPDSVVWAVRTDGQLLSLTFRRDEDVVGWSRHIIGGSFGSGDAAVDSVAIIPGDNGSGQTQDSSDMDEVWIIGKRTINGVTNRYVEVLEREFEAGDNQEDAYYADSLITYDGAPATVLTGYDHLEGETLKVLADGAIVADKTVTGGQITLDIAAAKVQAGLGYIHKFKTLKVSAGNPAGTPLGKTKRIYGLTFSLLNSHTLKYGPNADDLTEKDFRVVSDAMDSAVPLFTGEQFVEFTGDWTEDARIVILEDDPVPFTILAIAPETVVNPLK